MVRRTLFISASVLLGALGYGCSDEPTGGSGATTGGTPLPTGLSAQISDKRFYVADQMRASIEMQISGEPFAELLGRDIGGYDRFSATTDSYLNPETGEAETDTLGWSLAIESYEYSKQSMNTISFESGAGLSLQYSPGINPTDVEGDAAFTLLFDRIQYFGQASRASGALFGKDFVASPPSPDDLTNFYGWPGFWPVFAEFRSFDPTIEPAVGTAAKCDLGGAIDEPIPPELLPPPVADYECDYNTLNLPDRDAQVDKVIEPGVMGLSSWKQNLWSINYWAAMHDIGQNAIEVVPEAQLGLVGIPGNTVIGQFTSPIDENELIFGKEGTFLGGVSLEGFQGLVMIEEVFNKGIFLLKGMTTTDGKALSGFATTQAALDYNYDSPPRWWPAEVSVTETTMAPSADLAKKLFPKPTKLAIKSGLSRLEDISAVLGGYATFFAMTEDKNPELGGSQMFRATFDGDPWAADNQLADGEETPHDQALGILKTAIVNLDKLHFDDTHSVLVDESTPSASGVTKGTTVDTYHASYSIISLRTTLRALNSSLSLYGNDTPDQLGAPTPLDTTKLDGAPFAGSKIETRLIALIKAQADFISDKLLAEDGTAYNGYDLAADAPDASPATLEAQAAAVRGLLEAYLATSDNRYRDRAIDAFTALDANFWMEDIRAYRTTAGEDMKMTFTPRNFSALHGALRQYWKLVGTNAGNEVAAAKMLDQVVRTFKLVVNGWNDENGDDLVDATECFGASLQMAERALTGELSEAADMGDRDHDCVPDIATAGLPAALAASMVIERK